MKRLVEEVKNKVTRWIAQTAASRDDVDSQRVKAVRLAADIQYMRNDARQRRDGLPELPGSPAKSSKPESLGQAVDTQAIFETHSFNNPKEPTRGAVG